MKAIQCLRWLLLGVALPVGAQDLQVAGPIAGLIYDAPSASLRQVVGMPGAARVGAAVVQDVEWASVAPNGKMAIVSIGGAIRLVAPTDIAQGGNGSSISGIVGSPRLAAWAPDSSAVAVYSSADRAAQWIRIAGQTATGGASLPLTGVDGDVTAMTADGAPGTVVVAVAGSGVYRFGSSDGPNLVAQVPNATAIAMEPNGETIWVADGDSGRLIEIKGSTVQVLVTDTDRLPAVSAIAPSSDGRVLYVADKVTKQLYVFDRASAILQPGIALDLPAAGMKAFGRSTILLLGDRGQASDPVYMVAADNSSSPVLFFVPVAQGGSL